MLTSITRAVRWLSRESGLRFLASRKAATIVAVTTMALALAANTSLFAVTKAFLYSTFALPEPDRLHIIASLRDLPGRGTVVFNDAYLNYRTIRTTQKTFADVAVVSPGVASWDDHGQARSIQSSRVTASFFSTTGVRPAIGQAFAESDEGVIPTPVVVISDALWRGPFASARDIVGQTMSINGKPHTVIGVMPSGFTHPLPTDVWLPFSIPERQMTSITGARSLVIYGRLKDGLSLDAATAEMDLFTRRTQEAHKDNAQFRYGLRSFREFILPGADRVILFVQAAALVLLVLAVLNLSSLLVAWGFDRQREMAVRLAIGARHLHVLRLTVLQSLVVTVTGAAAGVMLAALAILAIRQMDVTQNIALFLENLRLDASVLASSVAVATVAGIVAGALPVWLSRRVDLADILRSSSRGASLSPAAIRWQKGLVLAQAALSVMMLSAAALIGISFRNIAAASTGFDSGTKIVARVQLDDKTYPGQNERAAFAARLSENLALERELAASGFTSVLPIGDGLAGARFFAEPPGDANTSEPLLLHARRVSPSYLEAIGIPLVQGRQLDARDDVAHPNVMIVSRAIADRLWPGQDPIGKQLYRLLPGGAPPVPTEIVGVAANVTDAGYNAPVGETSYVPYAQNAVTKLSIVVQPRTSAAAGIDAIRRALRATDPLIAMYGVENLASLDRQATALPRLQALLLLAFASIAIGIVTLGCYGIMSQLVANREREFALRLVFGAEPARLAGDVFMQVARLTLPGILIGAVTIWLMTGILTPFVFGIGPRSLSVTVLVSATVLGLAAAASLPSALRAMRVDIRRGIGGS